MNYIKNAFNTITEKTKAGWEWIKEKTFKKSSDQKNETESAITHNKKVPQMEPSLAKKNPPTTLINPARSEDDLAEIEAKIKKIIKNIKKKDRKNIKKKDRKNSKKNNEREKQKDIQELHKLYEQKKDITKGKGTPQNFNQFLRQEWQKENIRNQSQLQTRQKNRYQDTGRNKKIEKYNYKENFSAETTYPMSKESYPQEKHTSPSDRKKTKQEKEIIEERINAILIPHQQLINQKITPNQDNVLPVKTHSPIENTTKIKQNKLTLSKT